MMNYFSISSKLIYLSQILQGTWSCARKDPDSKWIPSRNPSLEGLKRRGQQRIRWVDLVAKELCMTITQKWSWALFERLWDIICLDVK